MTRTNFNRLPIRVYLRYIERFGADAAKELVRDGFYWRTVESKAYKSASRGYTEYGCNVWYAWMTDKGLSFLNGDCDEQ